MQRNEQAGALLETILKPTRLQDRRKAMQDLHIWDQLKALLLTDPFDKDGGGSMSLIEATGPGIFSDAVFSYLWTRYGIHWSQLHNIQTTTRIGEVAIVPITAFAPFERPDWKRFVLGCQW
jgi:alpha 1,6-mannosyltransferase